MTLATTPTRRQSRRMFYVYELQDEAGIPFYVGKGKGKRMHQHLVRARRGIVSHTCHKIRQMEAQGQTPRAVKVFETPCEKTALDEERRRIALHGRENLTNKTDGGDGVSNPPPEVREKIAASRRGVKASPETLKRLRESHLGNRHTEETRAKIAETQRGTQKPWAKKSGKNLGEGFKGMKWSAEHRAKFTAARKGHKVSQETRDKISKSKRGTTPWNKGKKKEQTS